MRYFKSLSLAATLALGLGSTAMAQQAWDMALPWGPNEFHTLNAQKFAEDVAGATENRVQITVHAGGTLGIKGPETVRSVRDGIVPIAEAVTSQMIGEVPIAGVESLPYLASSTKDLAVLHGLAFADVKEQLAAHNVTMLYAVPWPANQIYSNRELNSAEDFKGLNIRIPDANSAKFFAAMGANPIQMPIGDVLPALASGALDATVTATSTGADQKYWEFLKHVYLTKHLWSSNLMVVNNDAWAEVSAEDRAKIEELAAKLQPEFWALSEAQDEKAIEVLKANGMQVHEPSEAVVAAMKEAAPGVWASAFETIGPRAKDIVEAYQAATAK